MCICSSVHNDNNNYIGIATHLGLQMEETSVQPFKITSQPYSLEEFYKKHDFPQMACVVRGYFGVRKEDIISTGQELLLFFVKTSQVIVASNMSPRRPAAEQYYIPLNSSLWFVPHDVYRRESDKPPNDRDHIQEYKTVGDLLKRKGELPMQGSESVQNI